MYNISILVTYILSLSIFKKSPFLYIITHFRPKIASFQDLVNNEKYNSLVLNGFFNE